MTQFKAFNEEIKTIDNKLQQSKVKYNLDRQTAKISALASGKVVKYEFFTCKDVLLEKALLEKAVTIKRLKCSTLGSELKKQTDTANSQYKP